MRFFLFFLGLSLFAAGGETTTQPGVLLRGTVKAAVLKPPDLEITYAPGTDIVVVVATPFRTVAQNPPNPSDMTNLMFIAEAEELKAAFAAAGWTEAATLAKTSKFETIKALSEARGYKKAPMSILLLDGRKPDMDFEKMLNTFAMRHHLRIWKRPDTFEGKPVWVWAVTHDIGIKLITDGRMAVLQF